MTTKQFEEAEKIMYEIRETQKFLSAFDESYENEIRTLKRGASSLDVKREMHFQVPKTSYLQIAIVDAMKKRIDLLKRLLENI